MPDELGSLRYAIANIQALRRQRLLAREGQQPAGQFGAVARGVLDQFEQFAHVGTRFLFQQHFGVAHDDHEHVVEIVRYAAGKLTQRLERLVLANVVLETAALGDITHRSHHAARPPVAGPNNRRPVLHQQC